MADSEEKRDEVFTVKAASFHILYVATGIRVSEEGEICKTWTLQQWPKHNLLNPITDWTIHRHTHIDERNEKLCERDVGGKKDRGKEDMKKATQEGNWFWRVFVAIVYTVGEL